jgi:hypothetical protein
MIGGRKDILAPAVVKAFHKQCQGFKGSDEGTRIPSCLGYRLGAEANPFGTGAKDER